jgi:predicted dehydrogenase
VAKVAILAGKSVLCEKPLTVTAAEADELVRLAEERGVVCGTVFNNRFLAPIMRARQLVDEGKLGRILSFEFTYRHNSCIDPDRRVGWKQTAEYGGGTWYDLGPHVVDLCHYLCGELSFVLGKSQIAYPTHLRTDGTVWETDADEAFYVICGTGDGAMGTVTVSKLTQGANDELTFLVNGERGSLSFSLMDPNYLNFYDATAVGSPMGGVRGYTHIECVGRYPSPASGFPAIKAPQGWLRGHMGCMAAYLTAVANGTACSPSFADGAYVQRVLEAALESDRIGREVRLC